MTFLPNKYEIPKSQSNYFKFEDGENTIRILSSAIVGWEYFNKDNKPVRSQEEIEESPSDIKQGDRIKAFWAFTVWNYNLKKIQIMEVTQKTIMAQIKALIDNSKWGDIKSFDLTITRTGKSLDTSYSVVPNPKTDLPEVAKAQYDNMKIDLTKLYDGGNPFGE